MLNHRKYSSGFINASSRFASILLILLVIFASVFCGTLITSLAQGAAAEPVRCLHKVKVGDKSYCFFAESNVVLTPGEIAVSEDGKARTDDELTALILERAGFYMKEPNCNDSSHSEITVEEWLKDKGSFSLSKADLAAIRGASPKDGAPVKLYIDPLISTEKASGKLSGSTASVISQTAVTAPAEGSADDPAGSSGDPTDPAADPTGPSGDSADPAADSTNPSGGSADPATDPTDPSGGSTDPAADPTNPSGGSPDPAADPANPSGGSTDPVVPPEPVPEEITWYSVSALTSPSLLFVVIATDKDAEYIEEICEPVKEEVKEEASEQPKPAAPVKTPKVPKVTAPEETLPEFKTIKMYDRSGGPLEETLKDGDPVTLEWIAPKGNASSKKSFLDHIPGGVLGLAAIAAAGGLTAFVIVKKKRESSEEE